MHLPSNITRACIAAAAVAVFAALLVPAASAQPVARKRVVVVAGLPGSGKTTLSKQLAAEMKVPRHTCGDVVRGYIRDRGLPYTPQNDRQAAQYFAKRPGEIARRLSKKIKRSPGTFHIVDGVRSPADMKELRRRFDVRVVGLKVPRALRYKRMLARQRFAGENESYLRARDRREIGLGVLHVLREPYVRVDMTPPLAEVPGQARKLAEHLRKSW